MSPLRHPVLFVVIEVERISSASRKKTKRFGAKTFIIRTQLCFNLNILLANN
jgi:hypothetical protein